MSRRVPAVHSLLGCLLGALVLSGCRAPGGEQQLSPTEQRVQNLQRSVELLRGSLRSTAQERDRFKQDYLSSRAEQLTRQGDLEYLETRLRLARTQLVQAEDELRTRKQRIVGLEQQLARFQDTLQSQQSGQEQLRLRENELVEDRRRLLGELQQQGADIEALQTERTAARREIDELRQALARAEQANRGGLAELMEVRRRLESEVAGLRADLVAAQERVRHLEEQGREQQRTARGAVAGTGAPAPHPAPTPATTATAATAAAAAPTGDPLAFVQSWAMRSYEDFRGRQPDRSSWIFLAICGAVLLLVVLLLASIWRGGKARRRLRRVERQLAAATVAARSMSGTRGTRGGRTRGVVSSNPLDATVHIPRTVPDQPPGPATTAEPPAGAADPTVQIPAQGSPGDGKNRHGKHPTRGTGKDDELLSDLKSVIREKFSEL